MEKNSEGLVSQEAEWVDCWGRGCGLGYRSRGKHVGRMWTIEKQRPDADGGLHAPIFALTGFGHPQMDRVIPSDFVHLRRKQTVGLAIIAKQTQVEKGCGGEPPSPFPRGSRSALNLPRHEHHSCSHRGDLEDSPSLLYPKSLELRG